MDYTQAKILTEKILNFIQSLEQQDSPVLPMEQMLLQNYAKELYHALGATERLDDRSSPTTATVTSSDKTPVKLTAPPASTDKSASHSKEEVAEVVPIRPEISKKKEPAPIEQADNSGQAPSHESDSTEQFPEMEKGHIEAVQDKVKTQPLDRLQDFIEEKVATPDPKPEVKPEPEVVQKKTVRKFGPASRTEKKTPELKAEPSSTFKPSEPVKSFKPAEKAVSETKSESAKSFKASEPIKSFKPEVAATSSTPEMSRIIPAEIAELFEATKAKDLSERLGEAKLDDLSKAMGINEKIFTVNELFDGDHDAFDDTITKLNAKTSLKQAQDFLARDIAQKFEWADPSRQKKAKNFIKLVRRLYV